MSLSYRTVVCALDFAPGSARALVAAADLAERAHAALHLVHIDPLFRARLAPPAGGGDRAAALRERFRAFVDEALGAPHAFRLLAPGVHERHGVSPAVGIGRVAEELGADLIVVGTHGRLGLAGALMGSVAADVVRHARVPVWVVPERFTGERPGPARPVVVAVPFSPHAEAVLARADALAAAYGAPLVLAHTLDVPLARSLDLGGLFTLAELGAPSGARAQTVAHLALRRLADGRTAPSVSCRVPRGVAETALVELADAVEAGAVVVGTHGRRGLDRVVRGSVAEWVARHAACPVLVVPGEQEPAPGRAAERGARPSAAETPATSAPGD